VAELGAAEGVASDASVFDALGEAATSDAGLELTASEEAAGSELVGATASEVEDDTTSAGDGLSEAAAAAATACDEVAVSEDVAESELAIFEVEGSGELVAGSEAGAVEVSLKVETPAWDSSADTASAESEATVDAAGETAWTEDAGGSVVPTAEEAEIVDEGTKESVAEMEGSVLTVTTEGGPTAATTSPKAGTIGQHATRKLRRRVDILLSPRSSCRFPCFVPFAYPLLDLRCPFPPSRPSALPTCPKSRPTSSKGSSEIG
jgi:hypothetical protein